MEIQLNRDNDNIAFSLDDFDIGPRIGYGMCAKVYLANRHMSSKDGQSKGIIDDGNFDAQEKPVNVGGRLALKIVHLTKRAYAEDVLTERLLLPQLNDCHFIVRLYAAFLVPEKPAACLVLSLGEGGDLFSLHEREYSLAEADARFYLAELLCAIEYLHGRNILHRDIKTENVLLDADGHVKLCDFGVAKMLNPEDRARTFVGTLLYMAPEVARRIPYNRKCDIWGLGILFCYLVTGREPILGDTDEERLQHIRQGKFVIGYEGCLSTNCKKIIREMLRKEPEHRPDCAQIRQRKFLARLDWTQVYNRALKPPYQPNLSASQHQQQSSGQQHNFGSARRIRESYGAREEDGEHPAFGSSGSDLLRMLDKDFAWSCFSDLEQ